MLTNSIISLQNGFVESSNPLYFSNLAKETKHEVKRGIKHWKKSVRNCLKFVRLDRNPKLEEKVSKKYFGGGPVEHILFTKTESG